MKKQILLSLLILATSALCASAGDGKELYDKNCAKCHGATGKGDTKMGQKIGAKDLTDAARQANLKDEAISKAIKQGVKDGEKTLMKANEELTDEQIKDLVVYVRKLKK